MSKKGNKGFTLIETLVYLALLGLVFTGLFAAGFAIVESLDALKSRAIVQEEGNFLLAKINWVAAGSDAFVQPATGASGNTFSDGTKTLSWIDEADGYLYFGANELNSQNVRVALCGGWSNIFAHAGSGTDPESITACFKLKAKTPTGKNYEQEFRLTNYLRK